MMAETLRLLLVDDEPLALRGLAFALRDFDDVEIVGTAGDGHAALDEARRLKPDLIIMDVEMPGLSGMSVAAELECEEDLEIVIFSAFDRYAAAAFEVQALDYLVKPLRLDRLAQALERVQRRRAEKAAHVSTLADGQRNQTEFIKIPDRHGVKTVAISQVIWIEAARDYAIVHTRLRSHIVRITMSQLAAEAPASILRVHRSAFVNLAEVRRWAAPVKGVHGLVLSDETLVGVSPSYLADVRQSLKSLAI